MRTVYGVAQTLKLLGTKVGTVPVRLFDKAQNLSVRALRDLLAICEWSSVQMLFLSDDGR